MQQGKSNYSLAICSMQCFMWHFTLLFNKTMCTCIAARRSGDSQSSSRCQVLYLLEETHSPMCNENVWTSWSDSTLNWIQHWIAIDINNHKIGCTRVSFALVQLPLIYYKRCILVRLKWNIFHSRKLIKEFGLFLINTIKKKNQGFFAGESSYVSVIKNSDWAPLLNYAVFCSRGTLGQAGHWLYYHQLDDIGTGTY